MIATSSVVAGKIAETAIKKAAKEVASQIGKECASSALESAIDATESETAQKHGRRIVDCGLALAHKPHEVRPPSARHQQQLFKNCPEDVLFDVKKNLIDKDAKCFGLSQFQPGFENIGDKKPTPDAVIFQADGKELLYAFDIRPSDCSCKGGRLDRAVEDLKQSGDLGDLLPKAKPTKMQLESLAVIRANDEKMREQFRFWNLPKGIPGGCEEKLMIRIPSSERKRIEAIFHEIKLHGRSPVLTEREGVACIKYDLEERGLTLEEKEQLKLETGWSDEIIDVVSSIEEAQIYRDAGLVEREINGKPCLVNPNLDMDIQTDVFGRTNRQRMSLGLAPLDESGKPMELHHIGQHPDSPLAELTQEQHRGKDNYSVLHDTTKESEIDRPAFDSERIDHWQTRVEGENK